ncbi:MAG: isochorismate synthase [Leucobacter sp.]|nr:isochorismate synthase [Leucobacter sp.]
MLHADSQNPLLWLRGDRGCVGLGEALRLVFRGKDRFAEASAAWQRIAAAAGIDDTVNLPGSGLVAFGTFTFDDESDAESVLIVPQLLVARHGDRAWVTEVSTEPLDQPRKLPPTRARGTWSGTTLDTLTNDSDYLRGVDKAAALIERGEEEKVVLARTVTTSIDAAADLRVPLGRLAYNYTDCWTYAVDGMIGASPETLVRQTDGLITARVLAGTRGRREQPESDQLMRDELLASEKEQHEHAFAVQSVVTALAPHVSELHTSERPFALELPNVWHLATDLEAVPGDGSSTIDLVAALHPTAAVAGTPTRDAVAAISQLEPFDRERYAGATGWVDASGDGEWVIALRGAQIREPHDGQRQVVAYAGGGIVAGSDPEHELRETVSKFRPIAEALAP